MTKQIAVTNGSSRLSDADVAFLVSACNDQLADAARDWNVEPMVVAWYKPGTPLPPQTTILMAIVDSLSVAGALGFHDNFGGIEYGEVMAQSVVNTGVTLSHECLETLVDPGANDWWGDVAAEVSDPVEADVYPVQATVLGETRQVLVSNYVLPAWRTPGAAGPYDKMGRLSAPLTMSPGGYWIVRNAQGSTSTVFASQVPQTFARKLGNPRARTMRRLKATAPCPPTTEAR